MRDPRQSIESADSSGARACQTPDKASKPASNLSEPTCKAATSVEVSPAKPQPATSPKLKPAASIEQSSHPIEPSNRTLEAAMVSYAAPRGLPQAANGRHGDGTHPSQPAAKFHQGVFIGDRSVEGPDASYLGRHPMLAMYLTNLAAHNAEIGGRRTLREGRVDPTTRTALPARVVESHNRGTILDNVVDLRPHPTSRVDWALDTTEVAGKERHGYGTGHRVGITPSSRRVGMQCENETSSVRDAAAAYKTPQRTGNSDRSLDLGN